MDKKGNHSRKLDFTFPIVFTIIVIISIFLPVRTRNWIWAGLFFAHAIISIVIYPKQKRIDNLLTGIGLFVVGIFSILNILFIINITWIKIWLAAVSIIFISFIVGLILKKQ
jgi:hypothetical protein